jgi:signal recognition particle receptor subunit beta
VGPSKPVYLKFAVAGLTGAGTTSFIRSVEEVNELENWGRIAVGDFLKTQPQVRLDLLPKAQDQWEIVLANKLAVLILIDSGKPELFPEVKATMQGVRQYSSAPFIILANKQDSPEALEPEQIRQMLGLSQDTPIIACIAKNRNSITHVLQQLTEWALAKK